MADPLAKIRGSSALRLVDQVRAPVDQEAIDYQRALDLEANTPFERGLSSTAYGMGAGSDIAGAIDAQLRGDNARASALREQARESQLRAAEVAPDVTSYTQVGNLNDAGTLVGGFLGQAAASMGPAVLAGLATRGLPGSQYLGAAIPSYLQMRNEQLLSQENDPQLAAMDPQARLDAARLTGAINTIPETLVPGKLASVGMKSGVGTVGSNMGQEALTEVFQEGTGLVSNEALRQGGLTNGALAEPFSGAHNEQLINAGLAGAVGGGGMTAPFAGAQALLDQVPTHDALTDMVEELKAGAFKKLNPESRSDAKLASTDPTEVMAGLEEQEAELDTRAAQAARNVADDADADPELKAQADDILGGRTPRELYGDFLDAVKGVDVQRELSRAKDLGAKAVDFTRSFVKGWVDTPLGRKLNREKLATEPVHVTEKFKNLRPDLRDDPVVRSKLPDMVKLFQVLEDMEPTDRRRYDAVQRLLPALDWFVDPSRVLPKGLAKVVADLTRAQAEAGADDSWLTQNLVPDVREAGLPVRKEIGRILDRAALGEELDARQMARLERAFGSKPAARTMLRHYKLQVPLLKGGRKGDDDDDTEELGLANEAPAEDPETGEANPDYDAEQQGVVARTRGPDHVQYHFATQGGRPYLRTETAFGMQGNKLEGSITPAAKARRRLKQKDSSRYVRTIDMAQYARETGKDPEELAAQLRADFAKRAEAGKAPLDEQVTFEAYENDDEGLLRAHQVVRAESRDNARGLLFDNDPELHRRARVLVDNVKNAKTPEAAKAMRATHFKVRRKVISPSTHEEVVKPVVYSAESLWKYYGDKQQAHQKEEGGTPPVSEPDAVRAQNLFAQALAELAQDPSVVDFDIPDTLVIDRKTGARISSDERAKLAKDIKPTKFKDYETKAAIEQLDKLANAKLTEQDFAKRAKAFADDDGLDIEERLHAFGRIIEKPHVQDAKGPQKSLLFAQARRVLEVAEDMVDRLLPPPGNPDGPQEVTGQTEGEDIESANERAFDAYEDYVHDLEQLVSGYEYLEPKLARAYKRLADLEARMMEARGYDETTGEDLLPGSKDAEFNASGIKSQADPATGLMPDARPAPIKQPEPKATSDGVVNIKREETPLFNELPPRNPYKKTMTYAGIGSRQTPPHIMAKFRKVAARLEELGYTLRTGDAIGADAAFRSSVQAKEVYTAKDATERTRAIAKEIHPNPAALKLFALDLMARNTNQVFGANLDAPVDFVLVWTKDGNEAERGDGGSGQAMEMALLKGIPVINAATEGWEQRLKAIIEAPAKQPKVLDAKKPTKVVSLDIAPGTEVVKAGTHAIKAKDPANEQGVSGAMNRAGVKPTTKAAPKAPPKPRRDTPYVASTATKARRRNKRQAELNARMGIAPIGDVDIQESNLDAQAKALVAKAKPIVRLTPAQVKAKREVAEAERKRIIAARHKANIARAEQAAKEKNKPVPPARAAAERETTKPINVWYGSGENAEFSNLASRPFKHEGRKYLSVEHAYQSLKSGKFDEATYKKYTRAGVKIPGNLGTKTEGNANIRLMNELVLESFQQNPEAAEALLATGERKFTHTQDKGVWAKEFPEALENVRSALRKSAAKSALGKKFNNQETGPADPLKVDDAYKKLIKAEIGRIAKGVKLTFARDLGGASGEYNPTTRKIRLAVAAVNPLSVAYHEALHDFFQTLLHSEEGRRVREGLMRAASTPEVRAQLAKLLANSPKALEQIESDPEERVAYAFQFWAMGKHLGKPIITIGPAGQNIFQRVAKFIRDLLNVISEDERAVIVLDKLYDGKFAERNEVGAALADMGLETLADKMRRVSGPLADVSDKLLLTATDRLRQLGMDDVADRFHREPGREAGGLPLLQRRQQVAAKYRNRIAKLFDGTTVAERKQALRNLQSMKPPSNKLEQQVRDMLDELHAYLTEADVRVLDVETGKWSPVRKVANYFPRKWDPRKILAREGAFRDLLQKHGVSLEQSLLITKAVTSGDNMMDTADNEWHVGFTPAMVSVSDRKLDFINAKNAHEFVEFQNDDIADVLSTYVFQAVHRAEFTRDFGNGGEQLDEALLQASEHLSAKEQAEARNALKALVGTLGADVNPRMKEVMSAAIVAENLILLPLTLFSQLIDALGVGLRANDASEAWKAMGRGFAELFRDLRRDKRPDADTEMARTIGLIDDANMLEAMGQVNNGAFMSKFGRDVNRAFFKWNGMESWNRGMRISAMVAGERFIIRESGNDRFMRELGLAKDDIMPMKSGRLAVTVEQMKMVDPKLDDAIAAQRERKVQEAIFRFVDGAVLRPNAAQRPVWGSDPHWMLVFHLKQFAFSFHKTITARVANEFDHNNMLPAAILMAYIPVTIASGLAKGMLTGQVIGDGSLMAHLNYGVMRSGIMGPSGFGADALGDLERGLLPGTSLIGPAAEHVWMASRYVVGDPQVDASRLMDRSMPFARYF